MEEYIRFVDRIRSDKIEQITLGFIANGNLYPFGKDKQEGAVLNFCFESKISTSELEEFMSLVEVIMVIFRNKTCVPVFLEKFCITLNFMKCTCSLSFINNVLLSNLTQNPVPLEPV